MGGPVITLALRSQEDVLLTRRRARDLAGLLQLGAEAQSRLATAVWEVARLAHRYGPDGSGRVRACRTSRRPPWSRSAASRMPCSPARRRARRRPPRPRQAAPARRSRRGARRRGPRARAPDQRPRRGRLAAGRDGALARPGLAAAPRVRRGRGRRLDELRMQNAELVTALATLSQRERELVALNRELADTNRAVTALLAELGSRRRSCASARRATRASSRADPRAAHAAVRGARHDRGDPARGRRPPASRACARTSG